MTTENTNTVETVNPQAAAPVQYRTTATGRPTLVGTRHCKECGRAEYHTKKFEKTQNPDDLNERYTLCKGVCVYCYAKKRNKSAGTSLSESQLRDKIKFYTDLLAQKSAPAADIQGEQTLEPAPAQ